MRRPATITIAGLVACALAAGCSDGPAPVPVEPSSAFDNGGDTGTTAPTDDAPTDPEGDAPGTGSQFATGSSARLEVRGDVDEDVRLDHVQQPTILMEPPGGLGMTWSDPDLNNLMTIAGVSFTGARDTDPTTILTLVLTPKGGNETVTFVSNAGECTITLDALSTSAARGTLVCRHLSERSGNRTVDLAGSFSVQT